MNRNSYIYKKDLYRSSGGFLDQKVDFSTFALFFPPGYEKVFLVLYVIFVPYIAGLLFILFYVAKGDIELLFVSLKNHSPILIWCVGYEIVASILLLWIFWLAYKTSRFQKKGRVKFKRP